MLGFCEACRDYVKYYIKYENAEKTMGPSKSF
jgi:hypothetical protein